LDSGERRAVRLFLHQLKGEQLIFWRSREAAVFVFLFPILLFLLLGAVYTGKIDGRPAPDVLLAGMLGYGCATTAFGGLAIILVIRRESGVLKRVRATPLPPVIYLTAVLGSTLLVFALQAVALVAVGRLFYHAHVPDRIGSLIVALLLGAGAFAALGVAIAGLIRSAEGSSAVVNVITLPMAFISGSFGPTRHYPGFLRAIAAVLPLKYVVELVKAIYLSHQAVWSHPTDLAVIAAWGAAGLVIALRAFRWEPKER
jgi:ABC-2 type transport system permease protein